MKYTLGINTAETAVTIVSLIDTEGKRTEKRMTSPTSKSQAVLSIIEAVFSEMKVGWADITEVEVATGPGSFTGLRVGAAIGTTISWLLSLPINDGEPGVIPNLTYGESKWKSLDTKETH
jgi:tRNA threonylcarbamoyladenosine biosynthesis protein TsaB